MNAKAEQNSFRLALLSVVVIFGLAGCGQPASDDVEIVESAAPASVADEGRMASIDADGNVAPFGMASKQPVPVPELPAQPAEDTLAVSVVYATNCVACHGADATGVQGLGLNLVESDLVTTSSAEELVVFLQNGRAPDSPDSVTGVPMPAFAWMDAEDLNEVAGYLKSLQQ